MPISPLRELERRKLRFDPPSTRIKLARLRVLARTRLSSAEQVRRLHEVLCFMRAYPDSAAVLRQVAAMLSRFDRRADLRAHSDSLAHSGIAGTTLWFPFFYPTARWIADRWPALLTMDRGDEVAADSIAGLLPVLLTPLENHALQESKLSGYDALDRVRGAVTDATFLLRRIAAQPIGDALRAALYDLVNPSCELQAGRTTPSRTRAALAAVRPVWQIGPLRQARPDLAREIVRPPRSAQRMREAQGQRVIALAREAMATRMRDLDAFAYGNARDVWWIADDGGLAFAFVGVARERRAPVAALVGGLTLQNGVPIGYHQVDVTGRLAALSFNSFDTFRGGETAHVFARWLAALHATFGVTSFSIEPYQLGKGNDEAIDSGAWWFYAKLGFLPRARSTLRLARREFARQARVPSHRSRPETLRALAQRHLFFDLHARQPAPLLTPAALGFAAARTLDRLAGDNREAAVAQARKAALHDCGLRSLHGFDPHERAAWDAWAPLLTVLGVARWPLADRRAVVALVRAKAAESEHPYVRAFAALPRLERALARLQGRA